MIGRIQQESYLGLGFSLMKKFFTINSTSLIVMELIRLSISCYSEFWLCPFHQSSQVHWLKKFTILPFHPSTLQNLQEEYLPLFLMICLLDLPGQRFINFFKESGSNFIGVLIAFLFSMPLTSSIIAFFLGLDLILFF